MTAKKVAKADKGIKGSTPATPAFVTAAELDQKLESFGGELINKVAELVAQKAPEPVRQETPLEREVRNAAPDRPQTNPEWEEKAREILGVALDHTEFRYLKTGGVLFTVIIDRDHTNAPANYLEAMGEDRRTKEIGQEGTQGVEAWCKLIKQNLAQGSVSI